jgi:MYXO-CTERM domain-containing protein
VPNTNDASETCSCEKTGAKVCELIEVACSSDADCVTGFTCEDNPDGSCTRSSDGQESCTPANPPKLCMPPYSGLSGSGAGVPTSNRGESEGSDGDRVSDAPRASGGCSVVNAGSPGGFAPALAMLGLALGVARRRRR